MRTGSCAGCKWIRVLITEYCELCEAEFGGDLDAGFRQKD